MCVLCVSVVVSNDMLFLPFLLHTHTHTRAHTLFHCLGKRFASPGCLRARR